MHDIRIVVYVNGGDDIVFDSSPFLDSEVSTQSLRADTVLVSESTVLGEYFRFDRLDFVNYIDPALPSTQTGNTLIISRLRKFGETAALQGFDILNIQKIEIFQLTESGGVETSFRLNNGSFSSYSDTIHDNGDDPDLQIELLTLSFVSSPIVVTDSEKLMGKRAPRAVA